MSIHQTKNSPYWQYDFRWKGQRFHGSTREKSKRRAQQVVDAIKLQIKTGSGKPRATLDEAAESYWQLKGRHARDAEGDEERLARLLEMIGPNRQMDEINERDLSKAIQVRRNQGSLRRKTFKPLSNATINRTVTELFKRIHKHARLVMKVDVAEIDWAAVRLPEAEPRSRELSRDEEERLFEHLRADFHALVRFSLATGLRKADAASVRRKDVDLANRVLTIKVKSDRPGRKTHRIPITESLAELLTTEMASHSHDQVFCFQPHDHRGMPIIGAPLKPMTLPALRAVWAKAVKAAELEDFRWHDLRHTAGSRCARVAGLNVTKEMLGHESISTTTRYAHATRDDVRKAMEQMDGSPSGTPGIVPN